MTADDKPTGVDRQLLERAELALTQLHTQYGLTNEQSATLTAIRLRLEGKARASLDDLLDAGKDLGEDPLADALRRPPAKPSFEDALSEAEGKKRKRTLDDLL